MASPSATSSAVMNISALAKIVHVIARLNVGGAALSVLELAAAQQKRGHDVLVFHVMDDEELDFDYAGTTRFEGLEETGELICDPRALREGYLEAVRNFLDEVRRNCSRQTIDYQTIRTSDHLDAVLGHYINHRIGMRHTARA